MHRFAPGQAGQGRAPDAPMTLQVMPAPYQLPAGVSLEVVLPGADGLLVAGRG